MHPHSAQGTLRPHDNAAKTIPTRPAGGAAGVGRCGERHTRVRCGPRPYAGRGAVGGRVRGTELEYPEGHESRLGSGLQAAGKRCATRLHPGGLAAGGYPRPAADGPGRGLCHGLQHGYPGHRCDDTGCRVAEPALCVHGDGAVARNAEGGQCDRVRAAGPAGAVAGDKPARGELHAGGGAPAATAERVDGCAVPAPGAGHCGR